MSAPRVGFCVCELALDANDRCYVPDLVRRKMLRFLPDGHLDAPRPLPRAMRPSQNCMTATADSVYVSGQFGDRWFGDRWRYDSAGHLLWSTRLPSTILGCRRLVSWSRARRAAVDVYCDGARLCGRSRCAGHSQGNSPIPSGLAREVNGNAYVATYRVVWRFNAAGHVDAVYWSPDDDEVE